MKDAIRQQLAALDSPVGVRVRRKLTLLEAYCRSCDALAFAVVATSPHWVVRTWGISPETLERRWPTPPNGLTPEEEGRWRAHNSDLGAPRRREAKIFHFFVEDQRDGVEAFAWTCRCRSGKYRMSDLWAQLDSGTRRVLL